MTYSAHRPRYSVRPAKAVEVILWLANKHAEIDVYHVVKAVFYADKKHITEYGRPLIGDEYQAAPFGPLAQVVYGLLRHNPIEVLAASSNGHLPFHVTSSFTVIPERDANLRQLSDSDQEALEYGLSIVRSKSFDELYDMTHEDVAYLNADSGWMDYRDFIAMDDPDRDAKREDLVESSRDAFI